MPLVIIRSLRQRMALSASRTLTGTITSLVVLMAVNEKQTRPWVMIAFLAMTLASLVLTRFFAEIVQLEINERRLSKGWEKWKILKDEFELFSGGLIPLFFLSLAGLGVIQVTRAFIISRWSLVGILFIFGFLARDLAGASTLRSFQTALAYTAAGVLLVFFRYLVSLM